MEGERITGNTQWDGLGRPAIFYAMISIWCGIFLSVVDGNICNVALPVIAQELGVPSADSIWVINAFQLVVMMVLLPFSTLGELYSYKKVYLSGVAVFTAASALCTFSHSLLMLTVSRAVQGLGAAMIMSVNTSIAKLVFPRRHLGKGVGINATVVALSAVSGPSIAAAVLSLADWPWLFAINIPVGILTFLMGWRFLPDNPTHIEGRRFNIGDALLNAAVFGLLIGCIEMYSHDVRLSVVIGAVVLLGVLGTVYVRTQLHRRYPMLPFDLLRRPMFSMSVITSIVSYTAQMMVLVGMPFMLLHNFGMDPVRTGAVMTSWPFVVMFIAPLSGSLTGRIHPGILGGLGLLMMSAGCFLLSHIPADAAPAPELRAQPPGRQCKRHALHRPPDRPGHRRSSRRPILPSLRRRCASRRHAPCRHTGRLRRLLLLSPSSFQIVPLLLQATDGDNVDAVLFPSVSYIPDSGKNHQE